MTDTYTEEEEDHEEKESMGTEYWYVEDLRMVIVFFLERKVEPVIGTYSRVCCYGELVIADIMYV
jgi:hypothetical protein